MTTTTNEASSPVPSVEYQLLQDRSLTDRTFRVSDEFLPNATTVMPQTQQVQPRTMLAHAHRWQNT